MVTVMTPDWLRRVMDDALADYRKLPARLRLQSPGARWRWRQRLDKLKATPIGQFLLLDRYAADVADAAVRETWRRLLKEWDEHRAEIEGS